MNGQSESIRRHVESSDPGDIVLCSVVKAELFYGAMKSANYEKNMIKQKKFTDRFISLPFGDKSAEIYGLIRSGLEKSGTPIGPNDLMIASIAIEHDITLITHNTKEFSRIKGLNIADWEI